MKLFFIFVITSLFQINSSESFEINRKSLLLHLDKILDSGFTNKSGNFSEKAKIVQECREKKYNFSVYYQMVYYRVCENVSKENYDFSQFCADLLSGNNTAEKKVSEEERRDQIYGDGIKSEKRQLALKSCESINAYYQIKQRNIAKNKSQTNIYPLYSEWLIHSVPFGLPVACGFTKEQYIEQSTPPSLAGCLPDSYKWGLYIMFLIDGLIILAIIIANVLVLAVSVKTRMIFNIHG